MTRNYTSDPKGRKFISAAAFLLTLILLAVLSILRMYALDKFPQYMPDAAPLPVKVINALMIAFAAVYAVFIILLLPMWYKKIRYTVNDTEIIARTGLFSRTYRIMRISSVQHAVRFSMPFSRATSFNFITLRALGGNLVMMFISDKDCAEIMELLIKSALGEKKPAAAALQRSAAKPAQAAQHMRFSPGTTERGGNGVSRQGSETGFIYSENVPESSDPYGGCEQLTFGELPPEQLMFSDSSGGQRGGAP